MVDVKKIKQLLEKHFSIAGGISIDPESGVVDVAGDARLKTLTSQLPVRFGHVSGNFYCSYNSLTSLDGAPRSVGGNFMCHNNSLTTLDGAPASVGGKFYVDYNTSLPLLRLLQYKATMIYDAPSVAKQILHKYAGTSKRGMLGAAAELTKAGLRDNARW
jgi:hypothetical protein